MIDALLDRLAEAGLNLAGATDVGSWDACQPPARQASALLPGARRILVFGSGGRALWDAFLADLTANPRHLVDEAHPLDAYVLRAVARADAALGDVPRRWFYASALADVHIDFRVLAELAGLGAPSRLGLLLHPRYGPWLGLRAACFVGGDDALGWSDARLVAPGEGDARRFDACGGCAAPCAVACPGSAFPEGRWDVDRCARFHREDTRCAQTCHARLACPVGAAERYPAEALAYHSDRASGRRWLRRAIGVGDAADPFEGVGPHWGDWRARVDVKS